MNTKILRVAAIVAIVSSTVAQAEKPPLQLKPTSPWYVNYANDSCRLARQFGEGNDLVYTFFDRYGPNENFRLTVVGKPLKPAGQKTDAKVTFGPDEKEQEIGFLIGSLEKAPALLFVGGTRVAPLTDAEVALNEKRDVVDWVEPAPISDARLKAIKYLTIGKPLRRTVTLETGSMFKAFGAMETCINNLLTKWGIDVERHKELSRYAKPKQSPGRWIVSSDYPLDMLAAGQPAIVEFRLSVGADGTPTACHIQSTTRPKEFDNAVCKSVMRRARFDPALDAGGQPLASYYRNRVRFQIP